MLILLIGMVSITGFSATTDLTKDSITVYDVDVGIDAVLVENNMAIELQCSTASCTFCRASYIKNDNFTEKLIGTVTKADDKIPLERIFLTLDKTTSEVTINRRARDGLTEIRA